MTYRQKLRTPEWLEFAAAFKKRHNWTCGSCNVKQAAESELTVHHIKYKWDQEPWEYPDDLLECVCWPCHKKRQPLQRVLFDEISRWMKCARTEDLNWKGLCERGWLHTEMAKPKYEEAKLENNIEAFKKAFSQLFAEYPDWARVCKSIRLIGASFDAPWFYSWRVVVDTPEAKAMIKSPDGSFFLKKEIDRITGRIVDFDVEVAIEPLNSEGGIA